MPEPVSTSEDRLQSLKNIVTLGYVLYAVALFSGITAVVAIVVDYVKKDDAAGTWLESHFRWQIRTFWFALLWIILAVLTWIILIGWIILGVTCVWYIYRVVKGWLDLNDNKPMYLPVAPAAGGQL